MMASPKMMYEGIADVNGVECFVPSGDSDYPLKLRADANKHRGSIYYEVRLSLPQAARVEILIKERLFMDAWRKIVEFSNGTIGIPRHHETNFKVLENKVIGIE